MPQPIVVLFAAAYAGCFASFVAVVIDRVPRGERLGGQSRCVCGQPIRWRHNVPGVSWVVLRGHAACCGQPIPAWLWGVEVSTIGVVSVAALRSVGAAVAVGVVWLAAAMFVGLLKRCRLGRWSARCSAGRRAPARGCGRACIRCV